MQLRLKNRREQRRARWAAMRGSISAIFNPECVCVWGFYVRGACTYMRVSFNLF